MGTSQGKQYPGQDLDDKSNHTENGQITSHQCVQEGNGSLHIAVEAETSTCDQSNFETIDVTASSRSVHKSKRNSITGVEKGTETKTKAMTNGDIDFKPSIHHNQESFDLDNDVNKNENARTTEDTHDEDKNHTRGESTELQVSQTSSGYYSGQITPCDVQSPLQCNGVISTNWSLRGQSFPEKLDVDRKNKRGLYEDDLRQLLANLRLLKQEMEVEPLLDDLEAAEILSDEEKEDILSEKTRRDKASKLILTVSRMLPDAYDRFLESLDKTDYSYLRKSLQEPKFFPALNKDEIEPVVANYRLRMWKKDIINQLQPNEIADIFLEYGEFTIDEYEQVFSKPTRRERSKEIVRLLRKPNHIQTGYLVLLKALEETNEKYLLPRLKRDITDEDAKSSTAEHVKIKATQQKGVTKRKTTILKESNTCEIRCKLSCERDIVNLEREIKNAMGKPDVKLMINNNLIIETETIVTHVTQGSIIIRLKGCRPYSFKKLFSKDISTALMKIMEQILHNPEIQRIISSRVKKLEVTLSVHPPRSHAEEKSNIDRMKDNEEFLLEELDALSLTKELIADGALTVEEERQILTAEPVSRLTRTRKMLKMIMEKNQVDTFAQILKSKREYIWKRVFQPDISGYLVSKLTTDYNDFVDNLCPDLISHDYIVKSALHNTNSQGNRLQKAQMIMQHVIMCDINVQQQFVRMLYIHGQMPMEISEKDLSATHARGSNKRRENAKPKEKGKMPLSSQLVVYEGEISITPKEGRMSLETIPKKIFQGVKKSICDFPKKPKTSDISTSGIPSGDEAAEDSTGFTNYVKVLPLEHTMTANPLEPPEEGHINRNTQVFQIGNEETDITDISNS